MFLWIILGGLASYFVLGEEDFKPFLALAGVLFVGYLIYSGFNLGEFIVDKFVMIVTLTATTAWLAIKGLGESTVEAVKGFFGGIWDSTLDLFNKYF